MANETYTIDDNNMEGVANAYANTSSYHKMSFAIDQKINKLQTAFLARIDSCASEEESTGATTVYATPLVAQTDAEGNSLEMVSIPALRHSRYQSGIGAFIVDPAPGDIGVFVALKNDSTSVENGVSEPVKPGSERSFDQSDSVMVGTVNTDVPEVYIVIRQDKTIFIHAPEGCSIETDSDISLKAGGNVTIDAGGNLTVNASGAIFNCPVNVNDSLNATGGASISGDVTGAGVSLSTHTHGGVQGGSDHTSVPD